MALFNESKKEGVNVFDRFIPIRELEARISAKHDRIFRNNDNSNVVEKISYSRSSYIVPSSRYAMSFKINDIQNYIDIELSLPKYFYGQNLNQLVKNHREFYDGMNYASSANFENHCKYAYEHISIFLKDLKQTLQPERDKLNGKVFFYKSEVEVTRIDLCFNQIHPTKSDALEYLKVLKRRSILGANARNKREYGQETVMWTFKNYSFKVYHKGSEFEVNDSNQLRKKNEYYQKTESNYKSFNIDSMQQFADRILRYEINFRKAKLNDLYWNKIWRKECPDYDKKVRIYKKVRSFTLDGKVTGKEIKYESVKKKEGFNSYRNFFETQSDFLDWKQQVMNYRKMAFFSHKRRFENLYHKNKIDLQEYRFETDSKNFVFELKVSKEDKKIYKEVKKRYDRSSNLYLNRKSDYNIWEKYQQTESDEFQFNGGKFSQDLFNLCFKFFWSRYNDLQIGEELNLEQVSSKIDTYNISVNKNISKVKKVKLDFHNKTIDNMKKLQFNTNDSSLFQRFESKIMLENNNYRIEMAKFNRVNKKVSKNKLLTFILLLETKTFDEIRSLGLFAKSTLYEWRSDLKRVDIWNAVTGSKRVYEIDHSLKNYYMEQTFGNSLVLKKSGRIPVVKKKLFQDSANSDFPREGEYSFGA